MAFEEILVYVVIALVIGFALGWFFVKAQITAIEARNRAELERWKLRLPGDICRDR